MNEGVKQLLEAEDAVSRTLQNLERLQERVGQYESARGTLQATSQQLSGLIAECKAIAAGAIDGVRVLTELSMPRVLQELEGVRARIEVASSDSDKRFRAMDESSKAIAVQTAADLRLATAKAMADIASRMDAALAQMHQEVKGAVSSTGAALDARLAAGLAELRQVAQGVADQVQQRLQIALKEHADDQSKALDVVSTRLQAAIDGIGDRTKSAVSESVAEFKAALAEEARAREIARKDLASMVERIQALETAHLAASEQTRGLRAMVVVLLLLSVLVPIGVIVAGRWM